jgi:hypothetical protein
MFRALCILLFSLAASSPCLAQPSLIGTYKLLSNDLRLDGVPIQPMGNRKPGATPEAKVALFDSLSAWAGPYRIEGDKLIVDVDTAWTEVWSGKPQVRTYQVEGRRLTLIVAPQPSSTQPGKTLTSRSVWEKVD